MANEITAIEGSGRNYTLLFIASIPSPIQVGGSNVVPTPANENGNPANPSTLGPIAEAIVTQPEKDALNAGTAIYGTQNLNVYADGVKLTNQQLAARARAIYAAWKAQALADYAARYEFSGIRIDEA